MDVDIMHSIYDVYMIYIIYPYDIYISYIHIHPVTQVMN